MKTTFDDRLQPFSGRSLKAFIWVHYNYKKKNFYFISRNVRKKIIYLKFILLVISELCLVYRRIFLRPLLIK